MRRLKLLTCSMVVGSVASIAIYSQSGSALYEGARLIIADSSAPIESGAFVVQNGHIGAIGKKGAIEAPAGAIRVDLTGKTVMPAIVNLHAHIGYERFTTRGDSPAASDNFTPENVLDHLQRQAFYGVGTVLDAGSGSIPMLAQFQVDEAARNFPPAAQILLMAGVVPPNGGPDSILIKG